MPVREWLPHRPLLQPPTALALGHWPDPAQRRAASHARRSNTGRQLKLAWALLKPLPHRAHFDAVLAHHSLWLPAFSRQAKSFEPLLHSFLDRRFNMAQRFRHLQHDLAAATQAIGLNPGARIAVGDRVALWPLGEAGAVCLGLNQICQREGLWALSLCSPDGLQVCQFSFSFLQRDRLMIGSVQSAAA